MSAKHPTTWNEALTPWESEHPILPKQAHPREHPMDVAQRYVGVQWLREAKLWRLVIGSPHGDGPLCLPLPGCDETKAREIERCARSFLADIIQADREGR